MDIGLSIMIRCLAGECPRPQRAGQFDGRAMMAGTTHHKVLIVGGGTAGITVAASLKRHGPGGIDIAIVEPSDTHYYQPAFTLVGAGVYDLARTRRTTESLVPSGVKRIKAAAHKFDPANNKVELSTGDAVGYDYLVVCTGVKLDWAKIDGLAEALGREGVCSNYSPDHVRYTWECIKALKPGSKAVFTQPPLPFKCPGAPQKIVYLTADYLQRGGIRTNVDLKYFVHAPVIFGVPFFARECAKVAERYGVKVHYQHNLVAVDAKAKTALFEIVGGDSQGQRISVPYDMLHVSPPQSPPDDISSSPLWERWRQAHLGDLLDGMTPMEFILRFTSTNPDLDTTIIGTINPAHLQANLDILQQGQAISFAAILVNTTPEYATICLSPSGGRSHTR